MNNGRQLSVISYQVKAEAQVRPLVTAQYPNLASENGVLNSDN